MVHDCPALFSTFSAFYRTTPLFAIGGILMITHHNPSLADLKVLVVDDNKDYLELLKFVLEDFSLVVRIATSVNAALKVLANWEPDILISDIAMPCEDGYSLIRQIRNLEKCGQYKRLPAIAITALMTQGERELAFISGFDIYEEKSQNIDFLATVIAEFVEKSPFFPPDSL